MGSNSQSASWQRVTKQHEARCSILREIGVGSFVIYDASEQSPRTRKAAPLMTDGREIDFLGRGCIPDELVFSTIKAAEAVWSLKLNRKAALLRHGL